MGPFFHKSLKDLRNHKKNTILLIQSSQASQLNLLQKITPEKTTARLKQNNLKELLSNSSFLMPFTHHNGGVEAHTNSFPFLPPYNNLFFCCEYLLFTLMHAQFIIKQTLDFLCYAAHFCVYSMVGFCVTFFCVFL